jgi:putative membrane protein
MLINLVAGLAFVAPYVYRGLGIPDQKHWVPGFAMSGFVALAVGLYMIWNWPLPGSYNIAIGDLPVLFGIVFWGQRWHWRCLGDSII